MASSLSQEEENYVRMSLLLTGISPRAARALFDYEFAPVCLASSLNKEYNKLKDLQRKRVLNQSQWNLLFPRVPNVPDSKSFDVTLIITLLRNLTNLAPPHFGYDRLPSFNETSPTSDLARIKYYRNFLAHLDEGKVDNTTFTTAWDNVVDAISRLGGQQIKQECDSLKVKTLDQSNKEIMLDIKRSHKEIIEMKKSVESLKKSNEIMTVEMNKLKLSYEDTVPWNIRAQINEILVDWKDNDKKFIQVRASKHVLKCIKENSCVTIVASFGVGKTATLRHVALQMGMEGYDLLLVTDPGEVLKFYNPKQKTLIVIDDLFGNYSLNQNNIDVWEPVLDRMKLLLSNKLVKIIIACRLQVYQDEKFESLAVFRSCVCNFSSDNMCMSKSEKESIAEIYLKAKAAEIIDYYDLYDCFPLLCKMYHENPTLNIIDVFQNPFTVYEAEIDKLLKKGFFSKYCALALCVMFNNNIKEDILTEDVNDEIRTIIENTCEVCKLERGTSRLTLKDELNSLINTFLKKDQNIYKTIHNKIFDFLVFYFGKRIIICMIKNAHSSLIMEKFLLEKQNNVDQFITVVPPKYHEMYIKRLIDDWSKGKVNYVFCNLNMNILRFRKTFLCSLKKLALSYQIHLALKRDVVGNDTALLHLCFIGDIPMIYWCLVYNCDVNQCRIDGASPLYVAAMTGWNEIVRILLDKGADYDKRNNDGWTPLMCACGNGHTEIVEMLLDIGAAYNTCHSDCVSLVMLACTDGHTDIVRILLDKGADYNKCDYNNWSNVNIACSVGHTEIVRMLLEKGADYDKSNNDGWTPLMWACGNGYSEIVKMLLDIGADFNKCQSDYGSLVMIACTNGHTDIVRMLLGIGANYNESSNDGWTPLMSSCRNGHTEMVRMLLDIGADYNTCQSDCVSLVMLACADEHTEIVRMLLDIGADYNKCDFNGWSNVINACSEGHTETVKILLEKGVDFNKSDNDGWTPLMYGCRNGHTEIVRMLLDIGADYNTCQCDCVSLVMLACTNGHTEIVRMLLSKGADYDKSTNDGWTPLMYACRNGHIDMVMMLLDIGADYNKFGIHCVSPVFLACCDGHTDILRMLLDIGADYNTCRSSDSYSPLMLACIEGHIKIVRMLLDIGADYNTCDNEGWSPLLRTCAEGQTEIVGILLDIGVNFDKCDNDGWSPVMLACRYGYIKIMRMLLDKGADYNKCFNKGVSPLMCACRYGHTEIVRTLLDNGAEYGTCSDGLSLVMLASIDGHLELVKMLLDSGADYNACDSEGVSPVMLACIEGHTEIVEMLLDIGADYDKSDNADWSPLMYACRNGHTEIVRMLLDIGADYTSNTCYADFVSPVMLACTDGHTDIVRMLLDIGADYNTCDSDGVSPVMLSCIEGYTEIVRMLLDKGADYNTCNNAGQSAVILASEKGHTNIVNILNEPSRNT